MERQLTDKKGYDELYQERTSTLRPFSSSADFMQAFEERHMSPYYLGGSTKGYVRGRAIEALINDANQISNQLGDVTVLDAGSGFGELSAYLALRGFNVIGVDISKEGTELSKSLAEKLGVSERCTFIAASLESIPIDEQSVDFVIGHASLHHFIKYEGVPSELFRVMKPNGKGYFADAYAENPAYQLFHNKEMMERLGDVVLNKNMIINYFPMFNVELVPTDWFVMLDKFLIKFLPKSADGLIRRFSKVFFKLDRLNPFKNRVALFLSGALLTIIHKPAAE